MALGIPIPNPDADVQVIPYKPPTLPGSQASSQMAQTSSVVTMAATPLGLMEWLLAIIAILIVAASFEFSNRVGALLLAITVLGMLYTAKLRGLI